ncbi:MAG: cupin domain-containing protein [Gemmatimonadota bacterium]|nr:MAG: cupin domain-containing protein [Gemmatimonadota bacterium]
MQYRIDFESAPWDTPMPGLRHKVVEHGGRRLRLVEYTDEMEPHWCEKGHIGFVLQGRFEIGFADRTYVFGPGEGVFIPSGKEHRHMGRVLASPVRALFVEDADE